MTTKRNQWIFLAVLLVHTSAQGAVGESMILNPATGDYTLIYADNSGKLQQATFIPSTKINPSVKSQWRPNKEGVIEYRYSISNARSAKQPIRLFVIDKASSLYSRQPLPPYSSTNETLEEALAAVLRWNALLTSPMAWNGNASPNPDYPAKVSAGWARISKVRVKGIAPGVKQSGFGFSSLDLPGIENAKIWGDKPIGEGYVDEGPDPNSEISKQLEAIEQSDFVSRDAAVPTIPVPTPFNAAVAMDRIRAHVATWPGFVTTGYNGNVPANKKIFLLEPTFAAQLDRYLAAAADAFRRNQIKAAREHLETVHNLLEKEHKDLKNDEDDERDETANKSRSISRLAARILDFDLNYVLQRTESPEAKSR